MSANLFGNPSRQMTMIGVTGTKGKTTTTHMIKSVLEAAGRKVGMIGTNGIYYMGCHKETANTTPESYELQKTFREFLDAGCDTALMEVSSQGLMMDRVAGVHYDVGVFTNLSPDHIGPGEHKTFEEYRSWKGQLFKRCDVGVVNIDDENTEALLEGHTCKLVTYGRDEKADYRETGYELLRTHDFLGVKFHVTGKDEMDVKVNMPGEFSVYNALAALAVGKVLGLPDQAIHDGLGKCVVKGRVELVEYHIPQGSLLDGMALKNVAASLQVKVLVCAVRRGEEVVIPDGNYVLGAGDCISVTAKPQELENFFRALGVFRDHARNVMVVGAGRITRFLAEQLSQMKMRVRVVDRDEQRCVDLSEAVPTALVIHGDATDVHLLAEEGLDDSDAFVALTGLDELNIMLAMYARCHNIECSVAKVNRNSFTELINTTAIVESTVSTSVVTVSRILQYVRAMENSTGGGVIALHRMVENQVEALEFHITAGSPLIGVPFKDMATRPNVLVGCITRPNGEVIIPSGGDSLQPGDSAIVITTLTGLRDP